MIYHLNQQIQRHSLRNEIVSILSFDTESGANTKKVTSAVAGRKTDVDDISETTGGTYVSQPVSDSVGNQIRAMCE